MLVQGDEVAARECVIRRWKRNNETVAAHTVETGRAIFLVLESEEKQLAAA